VVRFWWGIIAVLRSGTAINGAAIIACLLGTLTSSYFLLATLQLNWKIQNLEVISRERIPGMSCQVDCKKGKEGRLTKTTLFLSQPVIMSRAVRLILKFWVTAVLSSFAQVRAYTIWILEDS
jgi:hypothetical protein